MRLALIALFLALPVLAAEAPIATILCYHEVERSDAPQHATIPRRDASGDNKSEMLRYTASRDNFVAQLDYLAANGYTVIPLATLVDYLKGRTDTIPPRAVVITADDGWVCSYTEMLPELEKRGLPWTLFVYPKIVGRGSHAVTWKQLEEMARAGVDIQSHSFTHPFLTLKNNTKVAADAYDTFLRHELLESRERIAKATGQPVRFLCYPFGDYDATVAEAAAKYGYEAAVTTERGPITKATPVMALKRYLIHNTTSIEQFKTYLVP